jgi:hypothetical protein
MVEDIERELVRLCLNYTSVAYPKVHVTSREMRDGEGKLLARGRMMTPIRAYHHLA